MPALKPVFDKIFRLFSKQNELQNALINNPAAHMHLPSESFIDEHRMEQKDRWIHEASTIQSYNSSMSKNNAGPNPDIFPA